MPPLHDSPLIHRLCVIGIGLIGGSLARALRAAGVVETIVGCGRGEENLSRALELNVIDESSRDPATAVADADMVVIATTLGATPSVLASIAPTVCPEAVVTDVGSAKRRVVEAARSRLGKNFTRFVPGHPIAGTEKSGVDASFASLYRDHRVILTPLPETEPTALRRVTEMWEATGATVTEMDADHHDDVLAATSHLPHMLAYALVECLAGMEGSGEIFAYAAGGFRDFTRIASSNPEMWCDIAMDNRDALLSKLELFAATYEQLSDALESNDRKALLEMFTRAKAARDESGFPVA
ncbi:MAG TPA: prephenate dehydrogenase/arogenate dehydrogenase family protein [Gammaproteobacteria bacterium]|nr:prephenate dehydrogenase/arogenate dehydrogenase family protein [Gammaproteobacteria bacterium]